MKRYRTGFVAGAFEIYHPGYLDMFERAKDDCDILYVLLNRNGKHQHVFNFLEKSRLLMSIKYVDYVYIYSNEDELKQWIEYLKPDVRFLGSDYFDKSITGGELEIPIVWIDRAHDWSTTKVYEMIQAMNNEKNSN